MRKGPSKHYQHLKLINQVITNKKDISNIQGQTITDNFSKTNMG